MSRRIRSTTLSSVAWSCIMVCRSLFFFFSSRRRHTRFDCDWSSDVCSSDLVALRRNSRREVLPVSGVSGGGLLCLSLESRSSDFSFTRPCYDKCEQSRDHFCPREDCVFPLTFYRKLFMLA